MSHKTRVLKEERRSGSFRDEQRHSAFLGPSYKGGREDAPTPGEAAGEAVFAEERLQANVDGCIRAVRGWEGAGGLCLPVAVNIVKRVPVTSRAALPT